MRKARIFIFCAVVIISTGVARSERKYIIGQQYDFTFGETNQTAFTSTQFQQGLAPFYGFYPHLDMKSIGRTTELDLGYTGFIERFNGGQNLTSVAHLAKADFTAKVSRRLTLGLIGSFSSAPNYTAVDVLNGTPSSPDQFKFVFQPALAKSTMNVFHGGIKANFDLNYRSYVTVDLSIIALKYQQNSIVNGILSDQTREEGRLGYWYRLNPHQSFDVQYIFIHNSFNQFGDGRSQGVVLGYNRQFSPALRARFEAGPAYVVFNSSNFYGYFASASLMRKIRNSEVSLNYAHLPGDSSGLGSLANLHSAGISLFSPLWKRLAINSSIAGYVNQGVLDKTNNSHGVYGTVELSYPLSRRWFMTSGGSYGLNRYNNPHQQEFKRVYVSLRFRAPEFWRASR